MKAQELESRIEAYFAACDATRERHPLKNGGFMERQIPYTLYGLAAATGYAPKRILMMAGRGGAGGRVLQKALCRIGAYLMERALLGEMPHQMALAAIATLDGEKPAEAAEKALRITMDDAAAKWAE